MKVFSLMPELTRIRFFNKSKSLCLLLKENSCTLYCIFIWWWDDFVFPENDICEWRRDAIKDNSKFHIQSEIEFINSCSSSQNWWNIITYTFASVLFMSNKETIIDKNMSKNIWTNKSCIKYDYLHISRR